ncbi:MAG: L,D-transpeptidase family protein [Devosiaceae bacterium]|nr:L,D-transpeptidase family protein [Devosiaceae bacterium]
MNRVLASLLMGTMLMGVSSVSVKAQQAITINGVEAERVIIAPPKNDLARSIKSGLSNAYATATKGSRAYQDAQKIYYFYGARSFEPLWLSQNDSGTIVFSDSALKILDIFEQSYLEGLRPADYLTSEISLSGNFTDPERLATLETAFSAAAVRYAQHAMGGRINPRRVSSEFYQTPNRIDGGEFLLNLANSDAPDQMLRELSPTHSQFLALKATLATRYQGEVQKIITVPAGALLKPGMSDERVPVLRERLGLNITEQSTSYDDELVAAVEEFQKNAGLLVDGVIGPATVTALNGVYASKEDLIANMERWRWMPRDLGDFHVFVNIPEYRLRVMSGEEVTHTTRVVVGKRQFMTPVFSDEIEHVVVNPFWNVPASITRAEIGPALTKNPGYLAANNMELISGGRVVNASSVDWSTNSINNFRVRQRPGRNNALGTIKFLFPNAHAIYLHDTPSKSLFSRTQRAYSHGCVRVQNPMDFAGALLANDANMSKSTLQSQFGPSERWNNLSTKVPVHLAYFTLRIEDDGSIRSFGDVYGHNERLKNLLDS